MKQEYIEKIAFCFPSSRIKHDEHNIAIPTIIWVIEDDVDYKTLKFKVWLSIGFIELIKHSRYIVKTNVYKDGVKLTTSLDEGVIVEPSNTLSHDGRIAAAMTEEIGIIEKPENGIYKIEVSLHPYDDERLTLDSLSTYFVVYLTSSLGKN